MNYTLNFSGASVFYVNHTTSPDSLFLLVNPDNYFLKYAFTTF